MIKNFLHNTSGDNIQLRVSAFGLLLIMLIVNLFTVFDVFTTVNDRSTNILIICDIVISIGCIVGIVCINDIAKHMRD